MILHITIAKKIATYHRQDGNIICGNSDYKIKFTFDEEWEAHSTKTARFKWNGGYYDQDFTGDTCDVPIITNATRCTVGVFVGDPEKPTLRTTTEASIGCRKSVLCGESVPTTENNQYYANEAKEAAEEAQKILDEIKREIGDVEFGGTAGVNVWRCTHNHDIDGVNTNIHCYYKDIVDFDREKAKQGDVIIDTDGSVAEIYAFFDDEFNKYCLVDVISYSRTEVNDRLAQVGGSTIWRSTLDLSGLGSAQSPYPKISDVLDLAEGQTVRGGDYIIDGVGNMVYISTVSGENFLLENTSIVPGANIGDIDEALDVIIAIQNSLMGGDA